MVLIFSNKYLKLYEAKRRNIKLHRCEIMIIFRIILSNIFHVKMIIYLKTHLMQSKLLYNYGNIENVE